ncbi:methyltransferase, partial [Periconia macrospinosa]
METPSETPADPRFQTNDALATKPTPKSQLSKGMEHMRFAVTADPIARTTTTSPPTTTTPLPESDAYGVPASIAPIRHAPHRSHSPSNNQKRTDPFAFGSRYLEEGDDIFEFNAWDHVQVDETYREFSEQQYSKQRSEPVNDFDRKRFNDNPEKWWNLFYKNNKTNFFKNRKWLAQEFPVLDEVAREGAAPAVVLEVGAGAGNSAFPILQKSRNKGLKIHACDFSKKAVELIRGHELYDPEHIQADVWDVASSPESENGGLPPGLQEGSVDVVLMIFIFSALNPRQWDQAVRNIWRVLKPGGQVLFRDYGRGDLAQVRFKKGRYMEENFYVRGDGTRVYFFEREELEEIWGGVKREEETPSKEGVAAATTTTAEQEDNNPTIEEKTAQLSVDDNSNTEEESQNKSPRPAFEVVHFGVDRRMLVNRQRRLKMYRCWMQAVFRKPGDQSNNQSEVPTSTLRQEKKTAEGDAEAEAE